MFGESGPRKPLIASRSDVRVYKSKFEPWMCDRAIEMGRTGASKAEIAIELGVHRGTLADWAQVYPEFSDALEMSQDLAEIHWEGVGVRGMSQGKGFNDRVWSRLMAARFPRTWRESNKVEVSGGLVTANLSMTEMELRAAITEKIRRLGIALAQPALLPRPEESHDA